MSPTVELVFFSPTGTSRRTIEAVAQGFGAESIVRNDLTLPDQLGQTESPMEGLAIIGVPVYAGRVPALAVERLKKHVHGDGRPAALVVTYGNRAFEDALLELKDIAEDLGFIPVAGAAFIGEHSYSTFDTPVAEGRPDMRDESDAHQFGHLVAEKLSKGKASSHPSLELPGNRPFRDGTNAGPPAPETDPQACVLCGECSRSCPAGAIIAGDELSTNEDLCIRCCACTRVCPMSARSLTHEKIQGFRTMLVEKCSDRKDPEFYL